MVSDKRSSKSLFGILEKKEPALAAQLNQIKTRGVEDWIGLMHSDKGSHAGYPHLMDVERIADKMIPYRLKHDLTAGELFLLLSAIFLHDIGRTIPSPSPKTPCGKSYGEQCAGVSGSNVPIPGETEEYAEKEHPPCRDPQWGHHYHSEQIIREHGMNLGLPDERIAKYCGLLAFCHCLREPPEQPQSRFGESAAFDCEESEISNFRITSLAPYGVLRIPLLAAILRIADETDNLWTRAVREYWGCRLGRSSARLGKAFRRHIEDIEFVHEGECLIVHVAELVNTQADTDGERQFDLTTEDVTSIQGARERMKEVVTSGWGRLLKENGGTRFREVYIEYGGHLCRKLDPTSAPPALGEVLEDPMKSSLFDLYDAATSLALGGFGHFAFTWRTLEAQVGRPLTDSDKWITLRMGSVTPNFRVLGEIHRDELHIEIKNRKDMDRTREMILGG